MQCKVGTVAVFIKCNMSLVGRASQEDLFSLYRYTICIYIPNICILYVHWLYNIRDADDRLVPHDGTYRD